jgi:lipid II:glycine glycyltransferase (peptidoglycan interpeptide bridge formation enzyme)
MIADNLPTNYFKDRVGISPARGLRVKKINVKKSMKKLACILSDGDDDIEYWKISSKKRPPKSNKIKDNGNWIDLFIEDMYNIYEISDHEYNSDDNMFGDEYMYDDEHVY